MGTGPKLVATTFMPVAAKGLAGGVEGPREEEEGRLGGGRWWAATALKLGDIALRCGSEEGYTHSG